jgi:glycosyltransferase involved in cell wall biosynthesis
MSQPKPNLFSRLHSWLMNTPFLFKTARKIVAAFPGLEFKIKRILAIAKIKPSPQSTESRVPIDPNLSIQDQELIFIYVEHTAYKTHVTGITRVVTRLVESLCKLGKHVILVKLSEDMTSLAPLSAFELDNFHRLCPAKLSTLSQSLTNPHNFTTALTQLQQIDHNNWLILPEVPYHSKGGKIASQQLVACAKKLALHVGSIFYDNIPLHNAADKHNTNKHEKYLTTIAQSDAIWPISDYCCNELKTYYGNKVTGRILALNLAEVGDTQRVRYDWTSTGKTILALGSLCQRKNQLTLIKAFNTYCDKNPTSDWQLTLVGKHLESGYKQLLEKEARKNNKVTILNQVNDNQLEQIYTRTAFTVFPSILEGYGLPIVESLWQMRPCICANHGPMGDLAKKGGCVAIDMHDTHALTLAIQNLIQDRSFYQQKLTEILDRPMPTWEQYAQKMLDHMRTLTTTEVAG